MCFITNAGAADFTFKRIVDTNTAIPGGSGNFISFTYSFVSVDQGDVAFDAVIGTDASGDPASGIYTHISGNLGKVADLNTCGPHLFPDRMFTCPRRNPNYLLNTETKAVL